jgi:hypothetical protein
MKVLGKLKENKSVLDWSVVRLLNDAGTDMPGIKSIKIKIEAGKLPIMVVERYVREEGHSTDWPRHSKVISNDGNVEKIRLALESIEVETKEDYALINKK